MQSDDVVVVAPTLDYDLGLLEAVEDFPVEQFAPQLAVERPTVAIFPGASGSDLAGC